MAAAILLPHREDSNTVAAKNLRNTSSFMILTNYFYNIYI